MHLLKMDPFAKEGPAPPLHSSPVRGGQPPRAPPNYEASCIERCNRIVLVGLFSSRLEKLNDIFVVVMCVFMHRGGTLLFRELGGEIEAVIRAEFSGRHFHPITRKGGNSPETLLL